MSSRPPKPLPMVYVAQEFLDLLFWKFHRILDAEGISELEWAFMDRASLDLAGVPFSTILDATGESMSNRRRAAASLERARVGKVESNPADRRKRTFKLSEFGQRRTARIREAFKAELLESVGAQEVFSRRALKFRDAVSDASSYLTSGDLAKLSLTRLRKANRANISDDSARYVKSS